MSVTRLLISGLLVASGLILAAFTLHGAFDGWQPQTAGAGPAPKPWSTNTFGASGRMVAVSADAPEPPKTQPAKTGPKGDAKAPRAAPGASAAETKAAKRKRRAEKRAAEQAQKAKQQPQQTASQWPWSWFGN